MKAICFAGMKNVEVKNVGDPELKNDDDIILKVTSTAICGSDLHLIHGMLPNMPVEPILGLIKSGQFDATDIITHRLKLDEGEHAYRIFDRKEDDCIKVVLKP